MEIEEAITSIFISAFLGFFSGMVFFYIRKIVNKKVGG